MVSSRQVSSAQRFFTANTLRGTKKTDMRRVVNLAAYPRDHGLKEDDPVPPAEFGSWGLRPLQLGRELDSGESCLLQAPPRFSYCSIQHIRTTRYMMQRAKHPPKRKMSYEFFSTGYRKKTFVGVASSGYLKSDKHETTDTEDTENSNAETVTFEPALTGRPLPEGMKIVSVVSFRPSSTIALAKGCENIHQNQTPAWLSATNLGTRDFLFRL